MISRCQSDLAELCWYVAMQGNKRTDPAVCKYAMVDGKKKLLRLHRIIGERLHGDLRGFDIDHADGNPLNNADENLRKATRSQNLANSKKHCNAHTSRYKGVDYMPAIDRWRVCVHRDKTVLCPGVFPTEINAAMAYDAIAREYYKEFALVNFPAAPHITVPLDVYLKSLKAPRRIREQKRKCYLRKGKGSSKYPGVWYRKKTKKWYSRWCQKDLGTFLTEDAAYAARLKARKEAGYE